MKTRFFALLLVLTMLLGMLAACDGSSDSTTLLPDYQVSVIVDENLVIEGDALQVVAQGGTAEFTIKANDGFMVDYVSGGVYDYVSGKLRVDNVMADMVITVSSTEAVGVAVALSGEHFTADQNYQRVDKGQNAEFIVTLEEGYTLVSVDGGVYNAESGKIIVESVKKDTVVNIVTAKSEDVVKITIIGSHLSFPDDSNTRYAIKGQLFSACPVLEQGYGISSVSNATFNPANGCVEIENPQNNIVVSVSVVQRTITYHLNDGKGTTSKDVPNFTFYTAPNTRWDDGSLAIAGMALLEYNTAPDGSGEAYSLGSKVTFGLNQANLDLYCQWAPETSASDFTYESYTFQYTYRYRDWSQSGGPYVNGTKKFTGVIITDYKGNDQKVVIPAKLGGKDVIAIKKGAFQNKSMTTLVMTKGLKEVQAGAFVGCANLNTLYFSDSILSIPNEAFDEATYSNLHHFYLNATTAPCYTYTYDGMYRVKWDAVVTATKPRLVIIGGSSVNYGVSSAYLEALLDGEYDVINYGTIRTTCQRLYVEALASQLGEGDILIYAPESSSAYTMGSGKLDTFKIFRDTEGVYNLYRHVDIANYSDYFKGITNFNSERFSTMLSGGNDYDGYTVPSQDLVGKNGGFKATYPDPFTIINADGDMIGGDNKNSATNGKPKFSVNFSKFVYDEADTSATGSDITTYAAQMAAALKLHEANGVRVFFGFAPVNKNALTTAAKLESTQTAYNALVAELYGVDVLGNCADHIFSYTYMSQNDAHHLTDKGRVKHTFQLYKELCEALGIDGYTKNSAVGKDFPGCAW